MSNLLSDLIHICAHVGYSWHVRKGLTCVLTSSTRKTTSKILTNVMCKSSFADVDHNLRSINYNSGPKVCYIKEGHCFDSVQIVSTYPICKPQCKERQKFSSLIRVRGSSERFASAKLDDWFRESFCLLQLMTRFPICKPECKEQKLFRNHWGARIYFKRASSQCKGAGGWNVRSMLSRRHKLQNLLGHSSG